MKLDTISLWTADCPAYGVRYPYMCVRYRTVKCDGSVDYQLVAFLARYVCYFRCNNS